MIFFLEVSNNMTPQQIEYVLAVAEERSFSKAAKKLYVTQPSLSKFIINLETQLGVSLFDRSSSPITITEAGRIFIETANHMKSLEEDMSLKMSDLIGMKNGSLKIGTTSFYASKMLLQVVSHFHTKYPDIQISIEENTCGVLEEMLLKGDIDIMIGTPNVDDTLFNIEELCLEKMYLAVPRSRSVNSQCAEYALEVDDIRNNTEKIFRKDFVSFDYFKKERFIFLNNTDYNFQSVKKICKKNSFSPVISFKSNSLETVFAYVQAELGAAFIPDTFIKFSDISNHPVYYAVEPYDTETHIKLIYKKNKYLSKASVEFFNILRELIGRGTWR